MHIKLSIFLGWIIPSSSSMREIPTYQPATDFKPKGCKKVAKDSVKSKVSIIIPSLNESYDHVVKTFLSLKNTAPLELIEEIIFLNDGGEVYEEEMKAIIPQTIIIRHTERQGLIRSKKEGAAIAKAPILLFWEPHVIAQNGWLEPLIAHVEQHPNAVAMPSLDVWKSDGVFQKATIGYYRFEWNFNLMYTNALNIAYNDPEPYPTPATAGGIFAMRKDFFLELGLYDAELLQWGGDHIELAFKVWRCGGRIDMFPCSRAAHFFRSEEERPYPVDVRRVVNNYARIARIWLDQKYLPFFYKVKPEAVSMEVGELSEQKELKTKLKCKSMAWYLRNIDWEMNWEAKYVCIPGARKEQGGCEKSAAMGRATIDRIMPRDDFLKAQLDSEGLFLEEEGAKDEL